MTSLDHLMKGQFRDEVTFVDAAAEIDRVCDWLSELGISFSNTRVAKYRNLFNELAKAHQSGTLDKFEKKYSHAEFINAAHERAELVRIHAGLSGLADAGLVSRLKSALRGHELYVLDNDNRSGRDFGLELAIAARYAKKGYAVDFDDDADLKVDMREFMLFVECKRLKSKTKVRANVSKAIEQLGRRYGTADRPDDARGLIVLSITKLINEELGVLNAPTLDGIGDAAAMINKAFILHHQKLWMKPVRDRRLLGTAVVLDVPARVNGAGPVHTCNEVGIHGCVPDMTLDHFRLLRASEVFLSQDW